MHVVPLDSVHGQLVGGVRAEVLGAVRLGALVDGALLGAHQVDVVLAGGLEGAGVYAWGLGAGGYRILPSSVPGRCGPGRRPGGGRCE